MFCCRMASPVQEPISKVVEFEKSWEEAFPGDAVPRLAFLENAKLGGNRDDDLQQQSFRETLKSALDIHNIRISQLQKELKQEQYILEFIARELEHLPVPRLSNSDSPVLNLPGRPTPRPRKPPSVPKKPPKIPIVNDLSHPGAIRRNHSSPSPRTTPANSDKRSQFNSVYSPQHESVEEVSAQINDKPVSVQMRKSVIAPPSTSTDNRFDTFQGTTFGGSRNSRHSNNFESNGAHVRHNSVSNPVTGSPAIIENRITRSDLESEPAAQPTTPGSGYRNSMRNMEKLSINVSESSTSSTSTPDDSNSDYMHLWTTKPSEEDKATITASEVSVHMQSL